MANPAATNLACHISALMFLFGAATFGVMVAYMVIVMPKNATSVSMGLAQGVNTVMSVMMMFIALPTGGNLPKCLRARHKEFSKQWMLFIFHATIGVLIISDTLFLKDKEYAGGSEGIRSAIYPLMIAGASAQALAMVSNFLAQLYA
ncbi:hypothetical protein H4R18_000640 [Coemansia javaensis]|uniref:Uncharacterized protein n=1 Tax=Coemansia javaensis TaxID=2761396 RepID=A0A9W8HG27_9FUNG|nr:hypothetical protein H4R18_000640 [Coemansia javaensis]